MTWVQFSVHGVATITLSLPVSIPVAKTVQNGFSELGKEKALLHRKMTLSPYQHCAFYSNPFSSLYPDLQFNNLSFLSSLEYITV